MEHRDNPGAIVLFDGVCNLCNASINFIVDHDPKGYFKFASLQSPEGNTLRATCDGVQGASQQNGTDDDFSSVILLENNRCYHESSAVLRIARNLSGAWPLLYVFTVIPASVRDVIYRWIANNRYKWFGKRDACRLPTPELRSRFLNNMSTS